MSAGNFSSVILQRSGIGKSTGLAKAGISTLVESPNICDNFVMHFTAGTGIEVETSRLQALLDADPTCRFRLELSKAKSRMRAGGSNCSTVTQTGVPAAVVAKTTGLSIRKNPST